MVFKRVFAVKKVVTFKLGDRDDIVCKLMADLSLCVACWSRFTIFALESLTIDVPDTCESVLIMMHKSCGKAD